MPLYENRCEAGPSPERDRGRLCACSIFCSDESGFAGSVERLIAAVVRALAVALSGLSLWLAPGGRSSDGPDGPFREADEQ